MEANSYKYNLLTRNTENCTRLKILKELKKQKLV